MAARPGDGHGQAVEGQIRYRVHEGQRHSLFGATEILDIPFLLTADGVTHYSRIRRLRNTIGLAIALEQYASRFFQNGATPPLQLVGPFQSPVGAKRASDHILLALEEAREAQRNVLSLPLGPEFKQIGFDPDAAS